MRYLAGLTYVLATMAGCATDDMTDDRGAQIAPDDMPADEAASPPAPIATTPGDPATAARRALPAPTISQGGASTAEVTPSLTSGTVVIEGGTAAADYAQVSYTMSTGAMTGTGEVTINPAQGASYQYLLSGSGGGYSSRHIRLEVDPGSSQLQAATTTGLVACGAVPPGRATKVAVVFRGAAKTFDVTLDGAATPCTNLATKAAGPLTGFRLVDMSIAGYGGHVEFSDLGLRY